MSRSWTQVGSAYEISWGNEPWSLRVDTDSPGLSSSRFGPLLSLEGLAETGRREIGAFSAASLISAELRFDRVEASYSPTGWGEMTVKASWFPFDTDGLGLEIELSARSVEELHRVEVLVQSSLEPSGALGLHRSVEPRDRDAAALTYDGREFDLAALVTGPPAAPLAPWLASKTGREGWAYLEMVRPEDCSRRINEGKLPFRSTRYGLFGYDLERGVVLRGRLRGFWTPTVGAFDEAETRLRQFLSEPPPLRT